MAIATQHDKIAALREPFPYVSVGPMITRNEVLASFPWTDDIAATREVLLALAEPTCGSGGLIWDDQDQGWHILIMAVGDVTCFVEWNADGEPPADGGWAADAASLARQAAEGLARLETIHGRLVRALGHDYWTYRRKPSAPARPAPRAATGILAAAKAWFRRS